MSVEETRDQIERSNACLCKGCALNLYGALAHVLWVRCGSPPEGIDLTALILAAGVDMEPKGAGVCTFEMNGHVYTTGLVESEEAAMAAAERGIRLRSMQ